MNPLDLLRGTSKKYINNDDTHVQTSKYGKTYGDDNDFNISIWMEAAYKTHQETNKSPITIMLEDYAKMEAEIVGDCSGIPVSEMKNYSFIDKLLGRDKENNIFRNEDLVSAVRQNYREEYTENRNHFTQKDIYQLEMMTSGGLRYQRNVDDQAESALNFAKADIAAIESAYALVHDSSSDGCLTAREMNSYLKTFDVETPMLQLQNLDDYAPGLISPHEYASYIMALDELSGEADGLVSFEDMEIASTMDFEDIQESAERIYDIYFASNEDE